MKIEKFWSDMDGSKRIIRGGIMDLYLDMFYVNATTDG